VRPAHIDERCLPLDAACGVKKDRRNKDTGMKHMKQQDKETVSVRKVVVVGAGNIGSHLIPHLARMSRLSQITVIDRDRYEPKNWRSQNITSKDIGWAKADIQAAQLHLINPALRINCLTADVEDVPLGIFRDAVVLGCLDNNQARQHLSETAFHLGVPYIDTGVKPDGLLARINVYASGETSPCIQCSWGEHDYQLLAHQYPCTMNGTSTLQQPATEAPSALGALAAALAAIECEKVINNQFDLAAINKQLLVNGLTHRLYVTDLPYNRNCRFDHRVWDVRLLDQGPELTVQEALYLTTASKKKDGALLVPAQGGGFINTVLNCCVCGRDTELLSLRHADQFAQHCKRCGTNLEIKKREITPALDRNLPPHILQRPLQSFGFRPGDIFTVVDLAGDRYHYELNADQAFSTALERGRL